MERAHFVEIMQLLPDGVLELDYSKILFANKAACQLLELNETAIIGQVFPRLLEGETALRLAERHSGNLPGAPVALPETLRLRDRFLKITLTRGSGETIVVLMHDSTGELLKMEELQQQNQQLQHAKQELERRLSAIQVIQKLSRAVEYPYGYSEILDAVLQFVPELIQQEATAALVENADGMNCMFTFPKTSGWITLHGSVRD